MTSNDRYPELFIGKQLRQMLVGLEDWWKRKRRSRSRVPPVISDLPGVLELDRFTIRFEFVGSVEQLLDVLSRSELSIVAKEGYYERDHIAHAVPGTGPYRIDSMQPNQVRLSRHGKYWGDHQRHTSAGYDSLKSFGITESARPRTILIQRKTKEGS